MRDVKTIREAIAADLVNIAETVDHAAINGADPWRRGVIGSTPWIVLYSVPSPVTERAQRLEVLHRYEVEIIIAPLSEVDQAMKTLTPLIRTVLLRLTNETFNALINADLGVLTVAGYRQGQNQYGTNDYVTGTIQIQITDIEGEDYIAS
jgi:hypothetical protein